MARGYISGKTSQLGRSHTHHRGVAGGRWKKRAQKTLRVFKPNLQPVTIIENGKKKKVKLATKTIKRIKKDILEGKKPVVELAYPSAMLKEAMNKDAADKQPKSKQPEKKKEAAGKSTAKKTAKKSGKSTAKKSSKAK